MIGKEWLNISNWIGSGAPDMRGKVEVPLKEYRVEFTNGEVRSYYVNTHKLCNGMVVLKDVEYEHNGLGVWTPTSNVVKILGNVVDIEYEEVGTDTYRMGDDDPAVTRNFD